MHNPLRLLVITFSIGFIALASGCSTIVRVPAARFHTPESAGTPSTGGALSLGLEAGVEGTQNWVLSPDIAYTPTNTQSTTIEPGQALRLGASTALSDSFELRLILPSHLEAKYQWLGDPRVRAQAGNTSAAVVLGGGRATSNRSSSQFWGGFARSLEFNEYFIQLALPLGYRAHEQVLFYLSPSYFYETLKGTEKTFNSATSITQNTATSERTISSQLSVIGLSAGMGYDVGQLNSAGRPIQLLAECGIQSFKLPAGHATHGHCGFLTRVIF